MNKALIIIFCLLSNIALSQDALLGDEQSKPIQLLKKYRSTVYNGDTIAQVDLNAAVIYGSRVFENVEDEKKFRKLVRDIKKALPYSKIAGNRIKEYNELLVDKKRHDKKKLMKEVEKKLKVEFKRDLQNLSVSQGKILMKLIDRETGKSSYDLVKEFRGGLTAFFWQSFAVIYDNDLNMKIRYDKDDADKQMEEIIGMIERGEI
jgi:hypothetical protein